MNNRRSIIEYCQSNIMVIPQALYSMKDIEPLIYDACTGIFLKSLKDNLLNVEFYTNSPCIIYIESGNETIVTSDGELIKLTKGMALFLPQGNNLHSDFIKNTQNLTAYLVFFSAEIITKFITTKKARKVNKPLQKTIICDELISTYFENIKLLKAHNRNCPQLLETKLLELLQLLSLRDENMLYAALQSKDNFKTAKRNIKRLLNNDDIFKLKINDLANLSGRSVSTFSREFKAIYGTTPKQWLQEKRLARGNELLIKTELTVTHIAADLGYENISHFIKSFKEKYNVTPKQLKQNTILNRST